MASPIFSTVCPFCCGSRASVLAQLSGDLAVECPDCRAVGPLAATAEDAAERWNQAWVRITRLNEECARERQVVERNAAHLERLEQRVAKLEKALAKGERR